MSYETKSVKKDLDGKPIPQYFNTTTDDYEPVKGSDGAPKYQIEDGKDAALGATTDAEATGNGSLIAIAKRLRSLLTPPTSYATGQKTVGSAAEVELFAGASALANRVRMRVRCEGDDAIYVGPTGLTTATGYPILPGEEKVFEFNPTTATSLYAIAGSDQTAWIMEEAA